MYVNKLYKLPLKLLRDNEKINRGWTGGGGGEGEREGKNRDERKGKELIRFQSMDR